MSGDARNHFEFRGPLSSWRAKVARTSTRGVSTLGGQCEWRNVGRPRVGARTVIAPEERPPSCRLRSLVAAVQQLLDGTPPCFVAPESHLGLVVMELVRNIGEVEH